MLGRRGRGFSCSRSDNLDSVHNVWAAWGIARAGQVPAFEPVAFEAAVVGNPLRGRRCPGFGGTRHYR
jgi:hypothetical protein